LKEKIALGLINLINLVGSLGAVVNGDKPGDFMHNLNYSQDGMMYITEQSLFIYEANQINKAPSEGEMKATYRKPGNSLSVKPIRNTVIYSNLKEPRNIKVGGKFTSAQKARILEANRKANGGVLKSDLSEQILDQPVQSKKGVPANMNQGEVDHIVPHSKGGSNSNAQVLSKRENIKKSDTQ